MGEKTENKNKYICIICLILGVVAILFSLCEGINFINNSPIIKVHLKLTDSLSEFKRDNEIYKEKINNLVKMYRDPDFATIEEVISSNDKINELKKAGEKLDNDMLNIYKILSKNERLKECFSYLRKPCNKKIYKEFKFWKQNIKGIKGDLFAIDSGAWEVEDTDKYKKEYEKEGREQLYLTMHEPYINSYKRSNKVFLDDYETFYNSDLNSANTSIAIISVCFAIGLICLIIAAVLFFKGKKQKTNTV